MQNEVYYFIAYTIIYKFGFGNIFFKTFVLQVCIYLVK